MLALLALLAASRAPSTEYFEAVLLPDCTQIDRGLTRLLEAFDAMRSEAGWDAESGVRLQEFRATMVHAASELSAVANCA